MKKVWIMAAAAGLGIAGSAKADWQFTKWGMTPEQVVEASRGRATRANDQLSAQGDATKGAEGLFVSGEYNFDAGYWFSAGRLSMVELSFTDDQKCINLLRDLLSKYGSPVEYEGGTIARRMWRDEASGNRVALITDGLGFCDLQYAPLRSVSGANL